MTDLLKRWAELEPERCYLAVAGREDGLVVERWCTPLRGSPSYWWGGPVSEACILAAVIEAIEAQEGTWDYRLAWRMAPTGEHFGVVRVTREDGWEKSWSCYAKSPAAALLGAYLAALEAEATQ